MSRSTDLPNDYTERVYAGVLGKLIGVYLGRPFEGWNYKDIMEKLGEINYYVHEQLQKPLVVTDDDVSGTFLFFRALTDTNAGVKLTAKQIGQCWLNYIIEKKTVLWWGGVGTSTEDTAFRRLKHGISAPASGSIALNGQVVAEQIGAQIFIDAWGMVAPGDPQLAADFARKAGSVSHDGEAIYGAQVIAAMEAQAFVESDLNKLLDTGLSVVPKTCTIAKMIRDLRTWRKKDNDWRKTRERLEKSYGYECFGGGCHMIPNHGVIILALVYGDGDFQKSLMIANTAGWDTDCNSGNVGCILGIRNGLSGIDAGPDWRGPVADRMYLPSAATGDCITDAVRETYTIVNAARALARVDAEVPKNGARFHFEMPGSVQGFTLDQAPDCKGIGRLSNQPGMSRQGTRCLAIDFDHLAPGRAVRVSTPTFITQEESRRQGYGLIASPTLYPTQTLIAEISAGHGNSVPVDCALYVRCYGPDDAIVTYHSSVWTLKPDSRDVIKWPIPNTVMAPICEVGLEITAEGTVAGRVALDSLTWSGTPSLDFKQPEWKGGMWKQAWIQAADHVRDGWRHVTQDEGVGMVATGTREWKNYRLSATVQPHLAKSAGVVACYQGLKRYYALVVGSDKTVRFVKALDGEHTLAKKPFKWNFDDEIAMDLIVQNGPKGSVLEGRINGKLVLKAEDKHAPFEGGGIAMLVEEGTCMFNDIAIRAR